MEAGIGPKLAALRRRAGYSQAQLATLLRMNGISVTNQAVSKWETGQTQPNAGQFLVLCRVLKVQDVLETFTGRPLHGPACTLNAEGRRRVEEFAQILAASGLFSDGADAPAARSLRVYSMRVSAGTGQVLEDSDYMLQQVGDEVPQTADFGVRIAGDSMQPRFSDGQTVWVRACQTLRSGETGIVFYDGCAYCKVFHDEGDHAALVSLNPAYPPIRIDPERVFRVFGAVLG